MYAYRTTWIMKPRCMNKGLELVKEWAHKGQFVIGGQIRCYTPSMAPYQFIIEFVFENDEARDKAYDEFGAKPGNTEFWARWWDLAERVVGHERWNVTELE